MPAFAEVCRVCLRNRCNGERTESGRARPYKCFESHRVSLSRLGCVIVAIRRTGDGITSVSAKRQVVYIAFARFGCAHVETLQQSVAPPALAGAGCARMQSAAASRLAKGSNLMYELYKISFTARLFRPVAPDMAKGPVAGPCAISYPVECFPGLGPDAEDRGHALLYGLRRVLASVFHGPRGPPAIRNSGATYFRGTGAGIGLQK